MSLAPSVTIQQAKDWLRKRLKEGADCPVCNQRVQMYRRKINSGMARALIQIYRHAGTEWTRVQDIPDAPRGGDYGKLRFWGLLEPRGDDAEDGNSAGYWRITDAGEAFVLGRLNVPSHVGTYNNRGYQLNDDEFTNIDIRAALGNKFDYDELLRGTT